jgi:hypothetical protein
VKEYNFAPTQFATILISSLDQALLARGTGKVQVFLYVA